MFDSSIVVEGFLTAQVAGVLRQKIVSASLVDGAESAGRWGKGVKKNRQVRPDELQNEGAELVRKIFAHELLAKKCYPKGAVHPTFNVYRSGDFYARHEDNPIQSGIRADLSYTIFLSPTDDYDGGGLILGSAQPLKAQPGTLVVYPSGTSHEVEQVTRGTRVAAVGWIQSVVRRAEDRELLNRFFYAMEGLERSIGTESDAFCELNAIRIALMRRWAEL